MLRSCTNGVYVLFMYVCIRYILFFIQSICLVLWQLLYRLVGDEVSVSAATYYKTYPRAQNRYIFFTLVLSQNNPLYYHVWHSSYLQYFPGTFSVKQAFFISRLTFTPILGKDYTFILVYKRIELNYHFFLFSINHR